MLFKDGLDKAVSWIAYVQRVFRDGLWIYVPGPPLSVAVSQRWDAYEHHCLVATADDPDTGEPNPRVDAKMHFEWQGMEKEKRIFRLEIHLRCSPPLTTHHPSLNAEPPSRVCTCGMLLCSPVPCCAAPHSPLGPHSLLHICVQKSVHRSLCPHLVLVSFVLSGLGTAREFTLE